MEHKTVNLSVHVHNDKSWFFATDNVTGMKCVGVAEIVPEDTDVEVVGSFQVHRDYGRQFRIDRFILGDDKSIMVIMLGTIGLYGIGTKRAQQLVNICGTKTFEILDRAVDGDENAIKTITKVKGLTKPTVMLALSDWNEIRAWANTALYGYKAGLSPSQVKKAIVEFPFLKHVINEEPYRLTKVRGITFQKADEIAQMAWDGKIPIAKDSPQRYAAAIRHVLEEALKQGHLFLHTREAIHRAEELIDQYDIYDDLDLEEEGLVEYDDGLYLSWVDMIENNIVVELNRLIGYKSYLKKSIDPQQYTDLDLSQDQIDAIKTSISASVTVVTGGPGTGKTTCINTILNILEDSGLSYTLCAPTGKAAKRMEEATNRAASTIHRAIGWVPGSEPQDEVYTKFLIVDESSMIDTEMMSILLEHTNKTNVIFVGDADQLPPVGPGEPFMQMIESGKIPVAWLTQIHRQGKNSGIVHAAHSINNGIQLEENETYDDFRWVQTQNNDSIPLMLSKTLEGIMDKYGYNLNDVQVLTPLNVRDFGQRALNKIIQAKYNPGPLVQDSIPFKVDDRVIQTYNNYDLGVMNGEVGIVRYVATDEAEADMKKMQRRGLADKFSLEDPPKSSDPLVLEVDYGDRTIWYSRDDLYDLRLAYAITIHKSQGSEFPAVIMIVPHLWPDFELRQLIYTGVTRARKYCLIITPYGAIEKYIKNETRLHRNTKVAKRLQNVR